MGNHSAATVPSLGRLLIVDDEVGLMTALCEMLTGRGYEAVGCACGREALQLLREREFDLLLTDLMMPDMDGVALLRAGLEIDPYLAGIVMTGQGTVQTAVEALQTGAVDYIMKPFKLNAILPVLTRAQKARRLRLENIQLRETVAIRDLSHTITSSLDSQLIVEKAVDAALQQCEADEASILLATPSGDELVVAAVRGRNRQALRGQRVPLTQGVVGWVARSREPLVLQGEVHDPRFAPLHPRPDIRSALLLPMIAGDHLVGVLNISLTRRRHPFTVGQTKTLQILTSTVAAAVESALLYEEAERLRVLNADVVEEVRALNARMDALREEERTRIAREIHDDLGQTLTALKMDCHWLSGKLKTLRDDGLRTLVLSKTSTMIELINITTQTVQRIASDLRPGLLDNLGLTAALEWQVQEFARHSGLTCRFQAAPPDVQVAEEPATALFRICQEALTNVARHAQARRVEVTLQAQGQSVMLQIKDDGQGFEMEKLRKRESLGLVGMRERARQVGGELEIQGAPGAGVTVTVRLPRE
jgi:signal transduction histidine kinase